MAIHPAYKEPGSQKILAADADVDPGNLSRMLRGIAGKEITASTLVRLARALDVTVGWLVGGEGGTEPVRASKPSITPVPSSSVAPKSA